MIGQSISLLYVVVAVFINNFYQGSSVVSNLMLNKETVYIMYNYNIKHRIAITVHYCSCTHLIVLDMYIRTPRINVLDFFDTTGYTFPVVLSLPMS